MRNICRLVGILAVMGALAISAHVVGADEKTDTAKDHLAPLERFIGYWVIDAKWSNGEALQARTTYEWGLGKKIVTAKTFVKKDGSEYQRYEGIMAWNPKKQCLFQISFAFNGE